MKNDLKLSKKNCDIGPIRMCIICKNRRKQSELNRFQILQNELIFDAKSGRTMYICNDCFLKFSDNFEKILQKNIKNNMDKSLLASRLKERFLNGKY